MQMDGVARLWTAAREHAGLDDVPVRCYPYDQPPADGVPTAAFFASGTDISQREAHPLTAAARQDAARHRNEPRVLVFTGPEEAVVGGKLRHELEHVHQWLSVPDGDQLFKIYNTVLDALQAFVGDDPRGSAVLYNVIPFESDANAAAYSFPGSGCRGPTSPAWRRAMTVFFSVLPTGAQTSTQWPSVV
jgi:hypothetical protein